MAANFELTREFLDQLKEAITLDESVKAFDLINDLHPADIAEIFDELSLDEAKYLYLLFDGEKAADVLVELEAEDSNIAPTA